MLLLSSSTWPHSLSGTQTTTNYCIVISLAKHPQADPLHDRAWSLSCMQPPLQMQHIEPLSLQPASGCSSDAAGPATAATGLTKWRVNQGRCMIPMLYTHYIKLTKEGEALAFSSRMPLNSPQSTCLLYPVSNVYLANLNVVGFASIFSLFIDHEVLPLVPLASCRIYWST